MTLSYGYDILNAMFDIYINIIYDKRMYNLLLKYKIYDKNSKKSKKRRSY